MKFLIYEGLKHDGSGFEKLQVKWTSVVIL